MTDLFKHDSRIEEGTALRDLEKKVHWLMYQLSRAGYATDLSGNKLTIPTDCNCPDIENDALLVMMNASNQGVVAGSNRLAKRIQNLAGNIDPEVDVEDEAEDSEDESK